MKALLNVFLIPTIKAASFLIGLGWIAYGSIMLVVKAEGNAIRTEVKTIREIDMTHIDKRFDKIEQMIKEVK
jgi:hypothetical protein